MTRPTMQVRLVSPVATVFQGEAAAAVVPAYDGKVGILPGHAPYITLLGGGRLDLELPGGGTESFFVNRGVLKMEDNELVILTEYADREAPEDFKAADAWMDSAELEDVGGVELEDVSTPGNPLV